MLQDRDAYIAQTINSHVQMQSAMLKDLQEHRAQLSTCQAEKVQLSVKNDELQKQLQQAEQIARQAEQIARQARQDTLDMQERVQLAQNSLQTALGETCKAQQLATIELVKSQEHAAQIQEHSRINSELHERLQQNEKEYSLRLNKAEEQKQQAEQEAIDRILQVEVEMQIAKKAEKEALVRVMQAEEQVKEALNAQQIATERATKAETEKEQALADLIALRTQSVQQLQKLETLWEVVIAHTTAAKEEAEEKLENFRKQSDLDLEQAEEKFENIRKASHLEIEQVNIRMKEMQAEFAIILENKLSDLELQVENAEEQLRTEKKRYDGLVECNQDLKKKNEEALAKINDLELQKKRTLSRPGEIPVIKLEEGDEDENTTMDSIELGSSTQSRETSSISNSRKRKRRKGRRSSKTPRLDVIPAFEVCFGVSRITNFGGCQ